MDSPAFYSSIADYDPQVRALSLSATLPRAALTPRRRSGQGQEGCLPLSAGQLVAVTDDTNGEWWFGYVYPDGEATGAFPSSFVAPYEGEVPEAAAAAPAAEPDAAEAGAALAAAEEAAAVLVTAIADYDPQGQEGCLALAAGQEVVLTDDSNGEWWFGYLPDAPDLVGARSPPTPAPLLAIPLPLRSLPDTAAVLVRPQGRSRAASWRAPRPPPIRGPSWRRRPPCRSRRPRRSSRS